MDRHLLLRSNLDKRPNYPTDPLTCLHLQNNLMLLFGSLGSGPYWSLRREETPSRLSAIMTYFKLASSVSCLAARLSARPCMTKRLLMRRRHQPIKINRASESTQQHSCYVMQRCPSYTPVLPFLLQKLSETQQTISCFTHKQLQTLTNEGPATF